jgi:superfamily II DNA or RNA helicase
MVLQLKKHQKECIREIYKTYESDDKNGLIKMFCGSGKSFVIYHTFLQFGNNLSIIVVPSINLITQFNKDYLYDKEKIEYNKTHFNKDYTVLTVCSKNELCKTEYSEIKLTTDPDEISDFLSCEKDKIILVTYQSLGILFEVLSENDIYVNLICFDEAHHIVSNNMKELLFENEYYDNYVNKTLYFTATPINKNGICMYEQPTDIMVGDINYEVIDDENSIIDEDEDGNRDCGKMIYEYMHKNGVNDNILNDFKVRVDLFTENTNKSVFEAIARTILETGNNRVLTFHSRSETESDKGTNVNDFSKDENLDEFKKSFNKVLKAEFHESKGKYKKIKFKGIIASTQNRNKILEDFDETRDDEIYILASCKTIGEGVDTKSANMVVFVDAKQSYVEIVQNIGRICRKPKNSNQLATVLIPAWVDANKYKNCKGKPDERDKIIREDMNKGGNFNGILNVLSALRQEDPYIFELCLKYPEIYTISELKDNFKKEGLELDETKYELKDLLSKYNVKINMKKSEDENLNKLSNTINKNIQVQNQKILDEDIIIDNNFDETLYIVKTNDDKFMVADNKTNKKHKLNRPNRNIKPKCHTNPNVQVLWDFEDDISNIDKNIFGGFIKATVKVDNEKIWMDNLEQVKKYIDENGKRPSECSNDFNEKYLAKWIGTQKLNYKKNDRSMKNKNIQELWIKFIQKYKEYLLSKEDLWDKNFEELKIFINKNNCLPKIKENKYLGNWVAVQKRNFVNKTQIMNNENFYNKWYTFITLSDYNKYFQSNFELWENKFIELKTFIDKNNKIPSSKSKIESEKILGKWLSHQQQNYKNKKQIMENDLIRLKWKKFTKEYNKYFLNYIEIFNINLQKIINFINENNKIPSEYDKNDNIAILGRWIGTQKNKYKYNKAIMKEPEIRTKWEEFITEYQDYFSDNPAIKTQSSKSTIIKPKKESSKTSDTETKRKLSEYQELTKKMSLQKSNTTYNMFKTKPELWTQYHNARDFSFKGYEDQNEIPVNKIIQYLETKKTHKLKILDLGCGRNLIVQHFKDNKKFNITGYDYVSFNGSKIADISNLKDEEEDSIDICIYSQSLMGNNWKDYLNEGKKVLRYNGEIIISESSERYDIIKNYIEEIDMKIIKNDYNETNRWFYINAIKQ